MLKNLNGWVRDRVTVDITGAFSVPGEKDNERGLYFSNPYFEHKNTLKEATVEWR